MNGTLTFKDVIKRLRIARPKLHQLIENGVFPSAIQAQPGAEWTFSMAEVEACERARSGYLSWKEVQRKLQISDSTYRRLIEAGILVGRREGNRMLFRADTIQDLADALRPRQVMRLLKISRATMERMIKSGELTCIQLREEGERYFLRQQFNGLDSEELFTPEEAGHELRLTPIEFQSLLETGQLMPHRIGRLTRFTLTDLLQFISD